MERWTIAEPFEGRYRRIINFGGRGYWCMFDFVVRPDVSCDRVEVELADSSDAESVEWFPHLRRGMLRAVDEVLASGRKWVGVRVVVRKVYTHSVDTTAYGCEQYGHAFVYHKLEDRGVRIPEDNPSEISE